ncbi:hypothetical protein [Gimibacter soli]|uniref:Flagellin N-terminal domain-containing protein n=1 Tax=Gimibacter soli TaxID=3024400 RepID=A0AAE9XX71_9PROT|nr:hypothetical protein [Gimibacter soli]WCL55209.1 hypothetical protein PH603_05485 [Gimibacter soli]
MAVGNVDYLTLFAAYPQATGQPKPLYQLDPTSPAETGTTRRSPVDTVGPDPSLLGGSGAVAGVRERLDKAIATTDAALASGDKAAGILSKLRDVAREATDPELADKDRAKLTNEFNSLKADLKDAIAGAGFEGTNLLASDKATAGAETGLLGGGRIEVRGRDFSLGGDVLTLTDDASVTSADAAEASLAAIDDSLGNAAEALTAIGAGSDRLQSVRSFALNFDADTATASTDAPGVLTLTDAQTAAERVREILGQADTNIANGTPGALLSLFARPEGERF